MTDLSEDKRISAELARISVYFEALDENQKAVVSPLVQNAAFMRVTLDDLQSAISSGGTVDEYQNGQHQRGMKQSAALQAYNSTMKIYLSTIKTLFGFLPPLERQAATFEERFFKKLSQEEG